MMHAALARDVLAADPAHAEVHEAERLDERARDPVDEGVDAAPAGALEEALAIHCHRYPRQ